MTIPVNLSCLDTLNLESLIVQITNIFVIGFLEPVKDKVHWGKQVQRFQQDKDAGSVTAFFADGTEATGDLLVACDGIYSPVVCQLIGGKEEFEKLTNVLSIDPFGVLRWITEEAWSKIASNLNHVVVLNGKHEIVDGVKGETFNMFYSVRYIDRSRHDPCCIFCSVSHSSDSPTIMKLSEKESAEKVGADQVLDNPWLTRLLFLTVELKGKGGNHAMVGAGNLGTKLLQMQQGDKSITEVLDVYNAEMIERNAKAVKESHDFAMMVHTNPEMMLDMMRTTAFDKK